jgi:hypothetical protein
MEAKKVHSKHELFWGMPQVANLRWKYTGTTTALNRLDYQTQDHVKIHGEWHVQCNCIVLITVQSAENQVWGQLEVKSSYIDEFGVDSSQSQDNPLTPPPRHRKRKSEERDKVDNEYDNRDDDEVSGGK